MHAKHSAKRILCSRRRAREARREFLSFCEQAYVVALLSFHRFTDTAFSSDHYLSERLDPSIVIAVQAPFLLGKWRGKLKRTMPAFDDLGTFPSLKSESGKRGSGNVFRQFQALKEKADREKQRPSRSPVAL
jgi:hypothetical protein